MARKKFTIVVIPSDSSGTRRYGVTPRMLAVALLAIFSMAGLSLYLGYDRRSLERNLSSLVPLQERTRAQRRLLERFGGRLRDLDRNLVRLRKLEEQLRIMASLKPRDRKNDFGVGGVASNEPPDSLEKLAPSERRFAGRLNRQFLDIERRTAEQEGFFKEVIRAFRSRSVLLAHTPSILPVKGWLTSGFGRRKSAFTGRREFHSGIDVVARAGTPIHATADGVVIKSGRQAGYGNIVEIRHMQGIVTRFAHNRKNLVKVGQRVRRGDIIALVGSTGRSTGAHVHYEVRLNGVAVNPLTYIVERVARR